VEIEFRKVVRKEVLLDGTCTSSIRPREAIRILVRDLSLSGCRFEPLKDYPFRLDEKIEGEFHLDDPQRTRIRKSAVVRSVLGTRIGCRFQDPPGILDPDLGFYLRK